MALFYGKSCPRVPTGPDTSYCLKSSSWAPWASTDHALECCKWRTHKRDLQLWVVLCSVCRHAAGSGWSRLGHGERYVCGHGRGWVGTWVHAPTKENVSLLHWRTLPAWFFFAHQAMILAQARSSMHSKISFSLISTAFIWRAIFVLSSLKIAMISSPSVDNMSRRELGETDGYLKRKNQMRRILLCCGNVVSYGDLHHI